MHLNHIKPILRFSLLFSICAVLAVFPSVAFGASRYEIRDVGFRNSAYFVSDAPLETVVGITNFVSGWVEFDPASLKDGIKGSLEIDARTFETGMPARNAKVRELFLGASKQPIITFVPQRWSQWSAPSLKPGASVSAKVEGVLTANGVESRIAIPVRFTFWKESPQTKKRLVGNLVQIRTEFTLRLADFKIAIPVNFQGLISPEAKIAVHLFATDRLPSSVPP